MKIIDSHIHLYDNPYFDQIAEAAGHENTCEHLKKAFDTSGVVHAVVMGNRDLIFDDHDFPGYVSYCAGLDSNYFQGKNIQSAADMVEKHFKNKNCVGVKIYAGYNPYYVSDPIYSPIYELAKAYDKPVAIHTGATASSNALLKYSHPLTVDEAASAHPDVHFVMCHFGSPWLVDAAAVMDKNPNVSADLSGILEGLIDVPEFCRDMSGYVEQLKTWMQYVADFDRFMYGTDWPLANIDNYIEFTKRVVPEKHYEKVFFENAKRIYHLDV